MRATEAKAIFVPRLRELGFTEGRGPLFMPISEDWIGEVGWTIATRMMPESARVEPLPGIIHIPTERLVAELRGRPLDKLLPVTCSTPVTDLTHPRRSAARWVGGPGDETDAMIADMRELGLPYIASLMDLDVLAADRGIGGPMRREYVRPVVLAEIGQVEKGRQDLESTLDEVREQDNAWTVNFRAFAKAFFERFDR